MKAFVRFFDDKPHSIGSKFVVEAQTTTAFRGEWFGSDTSMDGLMIDDFRIVGMGPQIAYRPLSAFAFTTTHAGCALATVDPYRKLKLTIHTFCNIKRFDVRIDGFAMMDDMLYKEPVDVTYVPDTISTKYPHKCEKCGAPAYVGFLSVECSQGCKP
jgi:hypothetical protein